MESLAQFSGKFCTINTQKSYVFDWEDDEIHETFFEVYEGCAFEEAVEDGDLIPFAVIIEHPNALGHLKKEPSFDEVVENQGGGELPALLLYEPESGKVMLSDEGGELEEFAGSLAALKIQPER